MRAPLRAGNAACARSQPLESTLREPREGDRFDIIGIEPKRGCAGDAVGRNQRGDGAEQS